MAAELGGDGGGKHKGGKPKGKKMSTRIDFTPMVDLGFLLITFFMLTTTMSKPQTMSVMLPSNEKVEIDNKVPESATITVIIGKNNKIYYYEGKTPEDASGLKETDLSANGLRKILVAKNAPYITRIDELKARYPDKKDEETLKKAIQEVKYERLATVLLMKATEKGVFSNMVDVIDEMNVAEIGKYAIVDLSAKEKEMLKTRNFE